MNIAHISTSITLNQTVFNRMVFQKQNGHRVVALCPDDEWASALKEHNFEVMDVPFVRHSAFHSFTIAALKTYLICRRERFDVVHTHTFLPGIVGRVMARLAGVPAVVHTFHSWPLHKPRGFIYTLFWKILELIAAFFSHAILFQNIDDLNSWAQIPGMPRKKAILVGNGINSQMILQKVSPGAREKIRQEFNISEDTTVIVMVSRLELYKGHTTVLKSLQQISSSTNHKIIALFVGIGKDQPTIEDEVHRLGLSNVVKFTGYRLDVPDIISASDISVLTSQYEGIPRALMESMILKVPVIATNVPGTRSLILSGDNGLLVEHNNSVELTAAIEYLINNPVDAKKLAERGMRTILQDYEERKIADRVEEIFQQILKTGLPPIPKVNLKADL